MHVITLRSFLDYICYTLPSNSAAGQYVCFCRKGMCSYCCISWKPQWRHAALRSCVPCCLLSVTNNWTAPAADHHLHTYCTHFTNVLLYLKFRFNLNCRHPPYWESWTNAALLLYTSKLRKILFLLLLMLGTLFCEEEDLISNTITLWLNVKLEKGHSFQKISLLQLAFLPAGVPVM